MRGREVFLDVYRSKLATLDKLSMEREGVVKKSQNFVYVECERPPKYFSTNQYFHRKIKLLSNFSLSIDKKLFYTVSQISNLNQNEV